MDKPVTWITLLFFIAVCLALWWWGAAKGGTAKESHEQKPRATDMALLPAPSYWKNDTANVPSITIDGHTIKVGDVVNVKTSSRTMPVIVGIITQNSRTKAVSIFGPFVTSVSKNGTISNLQGLYAALSDENTKFVRLNLGTTYQSNGSGIESDVFTFDVTDEQIASLPDSFAVSAMDGTQAMSDAIRAYASNAFEDMPAFYKTLLTMITAGTDTTVEDALTALQKASRMTFTGLERTVTFDFSNGVAGNLETAWGVKAPVYIPAAPEEGEFSDVFDYLNARMAWMTARDYAVKYNASLAKLQAGEAELELERRAAAYEDPYFQNVSKLVRNELPKNWLGLSEDGTITETGIRRVMRVASVISRATSKWFEVDKLSSGEVEDLAKALGITTDAVESAEFAVDILGALASACIFTGLAFDIVFDSLKAHFAAVGGGSAVTPPVLPLKACFFFTNNTSIDLKLSVVNIMNQNGEHGGQPDLFCQVTIPANTSRVTYIPLDQPGGKCPSGSCASEGGGLWCNDGTCEQTCKSDSDGRTNGFCQCSNNSDCMQGQSCENHTCRESSLYAVGVTDPWSTNYAWMDNVQWFNGSTNTYGVKEPVWFSLDQLASEVAGSSMLFSASHGLQYGYLKDRVQGSCSEGGACGVPYQTCCVDPLSGGSDSSSGSCQSRLVCGETSQAWEALPMQKNMLEGVSVCTKSQNYGFDDLGKGYAPSSAACYVPDNKITSGTELMFKVPDSLNFGYPDGYTPSADGTSASAAPGTFAHPPGNTTINGKSVSLESPVLYNSQGQFLLSHDEVQQWLAAASSAATGSTQVWDPTTGMYVDKIITWSTLDTASPPIMFSAPTSCACGDVAVSGLCSVNEAALNTTAVYDDLDAEQQAGRTLASNKAYMPHMAALVQAYYSRMPEVPVCPAPAPTDTCSTIANQSGQTAYGVQPTLPSSASSMLNAVCVWGGGNNPKYPGTAMPGKFTQQSLPCPYGWLDTGPTGYGYHLCMPSGDVSL